MIIPLFTGPSPHTLDPLESGHVEKNHVEDGAVASSIGKKLPTIKDGLQLDQIPASVCTKATYMFNVSRLTVKEKQHRISGSLELGSGFFSEQLVKMAF
jgi:hypothetical protein